MQARAHAGSRQRPHLLRCLPVLHHAAPKDIPSRKAGKLNDILDRLDHHAVPTAVEKLQEKLEEGNLTAVLETLKGRGLFRTFQHAHQEVAPKDIPSFQINILNAPNGGLERPSSGEVVGVPREDVREVPDARVALDGPVNAGTHKNSTE